jgi:hypothetical protein
MVATKALDVGHDDPLGRAGQELRDILTKWMMAQRDSGQGYNEAAAMMACVCGEFYSPFIHAGISIETAVEYAALNFRSGLKRRVDAVRLYHEKEQGRG